MRHRFYPSVFSSICCMMFLFLSHQPLAAQSGPVHVPKNLKPAKDYENIHVQALNSDEKASTFVIWIKQSVRMHKHEQHSETVYILKGKGTMTLGEKTFTVRKGDLIFIPKNTPHAVTVKGRPMQVLSVQAPKFEGKDRVFID